MMWWESFFMILSTYCPCNPLIFGCAFFLLDLVILFYVFWNIIERMFYFFCTMFKNLIFCDILNIIYIIFIHFKKYIIDFTK